MPQNFIINLPAVIIGNVTQPQLNSTALQTSLITETDFSSWELVFYIGMGMSALLFLFKIAKLLLMFYQNPRIKKGDVFVVNLMNSNTAFSFFNYIFLGEKINEVEKECILKHEIIHVKQKHTWDLLLFEMLRILFWFNPFIYMYQNRIMELHEFMADSHAVKHQEKSHYYQNLLSQAFETKNISFINPFFKQSLIKKRIVMLQKSKSKHVKLLKYALLIPVVIGMLMYSSCEKQVETNPTDALDLSQYSYTVNIGEGKNKSAENKVIHEKYEAFLKANPGYVGWEVYDQEAKTASYSVHTTKEKLPEGFEPKSRVVNFLEGGSYNMHFLFNRNKSPETEEQKAEKLLKQKEEFRDAVEVPFSVVEQVPVFPGCEDMSNDEQKKCMSNKITMLIAKNFNTNIAKKLNLTGSQRISVIFKINEKGDIVDIRSRATNPALEAEAIRVVKTLPKFKSGINNGKAVTVLYSLPIVFQVSE